MQKLKKIASALEFVFFYSHTSKRVLCLTLGTNATMVHFAHLTIVSFATIV